MKIIILVKPVILNVQLVVDKLLLVLLVKDQTEMQEIIVIVLVDFMKTLKKCVKSVITLVVLVFQKMFAKLVKMM